MGQDAVIAAVAGSALGLGAGCYIIIFILTLRIDKLRTQVEALQCSLTPIAQEGM